MFPGKQRWDGATDEVSRETIRAQRDIISTCQAIKACYHRGYPWRSGAQVAQGATWIAPDLVGRRSIPEVPNEDVVVER
jgi:hypothetical protein